MPLSKTKVVSAAENEKNTKDICNASTNLKVKKNSCQKSTKSGPANNISTKKKTNFNQNPGRKKFCHNTNLAKIKDHTETSLKNTKINDNKNAINKTNESNLIINTNNNNLQNATNSDKIPFNALQDSVDIINSTETVTSTTTIGVNVESNNFKKNFKLSPTNSQNIFRPALVSSRNESAVSINYDNTHTNYRRNYNNDYQDVQNNNQRNEVIFGNKRGYWQSSGVKRNQNNNFNKFHVTPSYGLNCTNTCQTKNQFNHTYTQLDTLNSLFDTSRSATPSPKSESPSFYMLNNNCEEYSTNQTANFYFPNAGYVEPDSTHSTFYNREFKNQYKNNTAPSRYLYNEYESLANFYRYQEREVTLERDIFVPPPSNIIDSRIPTTHTVRSHYENRIDIENPSVNDIYFPSNRRPLYPQNYNRRYTNDSRYCTNSFSTPCDKFLNKSKCVEVKTPPEKLINNTKWDSLSLAIWTKFMASQQKQTTFIQKIQLWRYLYIVIRHYFPRWGLYMVGSSISGFGTETSDVDLCLVARYNPDIDQRSEALFCLSDIQSCLKVLGTFMNFNLIEAKVPILRFQNVERFFIIDLNYNNCVGIKNTYLLYLYSQLDWRLKPMVLIAKLWADCQDINNAKNGTISSYSLTLMVIHFLQYGVSPAILPCLHQLFPDKFKLLHDNDFGYIDMHEEIQPYATTNNQPLGELFLNFLEYYTNFNYFESAISVRLSTVLPVDVCRKATSQKNDVHQWKYLCIEEPFDLTNTARSVYNLESFEKIKSAFTKSWRALKEKLNLNSVFKNFSENAW